METFLLIVSIFSAVTTQVLREESYLRLQSHVPRSYVSHDEEMVYGYKLQLKTEDMVDAMDIIINGTYLKQLDTGEESIIPLHGEISSVLSGTINFVVAETAPLGTLLRPRLYVLFLSHGVVKYQSTILGEYVFMRPPKMNVSNGTPLYVDMKEKSRFTSKIVLPAGPLGYSLLKVYMPNNVTMSKDAVDLYTEEPFLSVTKFEFVSNVGLLKESVDLIGKISPNYMSNSRSSETDEVIVAIPELDIQMGVEGELDFVVEAEMLDFAGAEDDIEMLIGYVLEVGDGIFVIRHSSVFTDMKTELQRTPSLTAMVEIRDVVKQETEYNLLLVVDLEHEQDSWGSAYNISWNIYLPAYLGNVTVGRTVDVLRRSRKVFNNRIITDASVYRFDLKRQSFVHNPKIFMNMTLDLDHVEFDQNQMTIYAEAVYNNWRDEQEYVTSQGFSLKMDVESDIPVLACKCTDEVKFECTCGDTGENGCDVSMDGKPCVDCNTPWKCVKTLKGYGKRTRLNDKHGNKYRCGKAERNQKLIDVKPCVRFDKNDTVTELNHRLGALLGKASKNQAIYGISRNGLAYMVSHDNGCTWFSISRDVYLNVAAKPGFIRASFF